MRKCALVGRRHIHDRDVRIKLVKSGFLSGRFCPTLSECSRSRNRFMITETGDYVLNEQRVYASRENGTEKKLVNSFVLTTAEYDEEGEI